MAGRGRGRSRGALNFDSITKNVGERSFEHDDPLKELGYMINGLDLNATSFNAVTLCASKAIISDTSDKLMEQVLKLLLGRCSKDWRFSTQAAVISHHLVKQQDIGKRFRTHLLRTMQTNFKERGNLQEESVSKYVGAMSFLCQLLVVMRSDTGEPLMPLMSPVIEVLSEMLEDGVSEMEFECGIIQVRALIPTIYKCDRVLIEQFCHLIVMIRKHLIESRGSRELRETMLKTLEENASQGNRSTMQ